MSVESRIANRLKDYKASSGLSNRQLAQDLSISERTLYRYLQGDIKNPRSKFTKNFKRRLYRRWRGSTLQFREKAGRINLSEYFRSVFYDGGVLYDPIYLKTIPRYTFINLIDEKTGVRNIPVAWLLVMNISYVEDGIELEDQFMIQETLESETSELAQIINDRFQQFYLKLVTSKFQPIKIEKEVVLLRWGKNKRNKSAKQKAKE